MTQVRKLPMKRIEAGKIYVAFSAKNRLLSSNGDKGVFVVVEGITNRGLSLKVRLLGTDKVTAISKPDGREDAWLYDPTSVEMEATVNVADVTAWPAFSQRMKDEGWNGKTFKLDFEEMYTITADDERWSERAGTVLLRHAGETIDPETKEPYVNNFLMSNIYPANPPEWRVPRALKMGAGAIELPLPPKPVAEQHNAIIDLLLPHTKRIAKKHTGENTSFARFDKDGKLIDEHFNQLCHRNITSRLVGKEPFYIVTLGSNSLPRNHWNHGHASEEAERFWVTYLTSYSPYADVFISKDVDQILATGYILDATKPNRLVAGACYATRQIWEKRERVEAFYALAVLGVPLNMAHIIGCQCSLWQDGKVKWTQSGGNHSHLYTEQMSNECMMAYIEAAPQRAGEAYNTNQQTEGLVDGMWSKNWGKSRNTLYPKLAELKGAGGWGAGLSQEDSLERAIDIAQDWYEANA